ncbi:hypothetical protein BpHYR1_023624 [Brachionus plicatilis]|uniref:Uncharacterized protein n=1 Tax=Brachionus plicatilis TaxID=10195 RepID=A0A3M7PN93_BRAPC|nr:hypothetical protein BpHYR1_023624 [Brachionus plicatilis]
MPNRVVVFPYLKNRNLLNNQSCQILTSVSQGVHNSHPLPINPKFFLSIVLYQIAPKRLFRSDPIVLISFKTQILLIIYLQSKSRMSKSMKIPYQENQLSLNCINLLDEFKLQNTKIDSSYNEYNQDKNNLDSLAKGDIGVTYSRLKYETQILRFLQKSQKLATK